MKTAILQVADTGPLESLALMLSVAGYRCYLPDHRLRHVLRSIGCDTVLEIESLVSGMGYERPLPLDEAGIEAMDRADLFVCVKGHRNHEHVVRRWPRLRGKVLWYRINGGKPEIVRGCGDEIRPPCPVLTPNQWYALEEEPREHRRGPEESPPGESRWEYGGSGQRRAPWFLTPRYVAWPPFVRFDDYYPVHGRADSHDDPVCLIHNLPGWGYRLLVEPMRELGVRCHGAGSPDGLVHHGRIPRMLSCALCMVHLKSNDAPGYALYEALAAGCPVVCTRRLIWRCRMQDLLIPGETCLVFDRETHDGLTVEDVRECTAEVAGHLERLRDPAENRRLGLAGRERLQEIMWSAKRPADVESLWEFFGRNFP